MRATGIVRRIDDLGRIVIPKEIRKEMRIREGEPLEIFVDKSKNLVCFQKYDIETNYLAELKKLSDNITEHYWSPETCDNLKMINIAIHEMELQLRAIADKREEE